MVQCVKTCIKGNTMTFKRTVHEPDPTWTRAILLIFDQTGRLLVETGWEKAKALPVFSKDQADAFNLVDITFIGFYHKAPCYCAGCKGKTCPGGYSWVNLRKFIIGVDPSLWEVAGYAKQIHDCNVNFKYCGKCGRQTQPKTDEQGRFCETVNRPFIPLIPRP